MKVQKEYIILIVIIAALSGYLYFHQADRTHYKLPVIPKVEAKEITKIEIVKPKETIVLNKKGSDWFINDAAYPADEAKVKDMLKIFEKLVLTAQVSESKNYSRYDLGEDKKITLKAWAGEKEVRELDVGKAAPTYQHTFVRLSGNDRVYHARENFRNKFDKSVDDFRDKKVLAFEESEIQKLDLEKGPIQMTLARAQVPVEVAVNKDQKEDDKKEQAAPPTEMVWKSPDGKIGDKNVVKQLIDKLKDLKCESYIESKQKEDLKAPLFKVTLSGNEAYTLAIFEKVNKDDDDYPATSSANVYPFKLSGYQADQIMKKMDEVVKDKDNPKKEAPKDQPS